ncbi:MAG: hypothetical protein QM831_35895 [Kofleriaceae bacterium]
MKAHLENAAKGDADRPNAKAKSDDSGNALAKVQQLVRSGKPNAQDVAKIVEDNPADKARIMQFLQQHAGNGFAKKVADAVQHADQKAKTGDDGQIHIITFAGLCHLKDAGPKGKAAAKSLYDNPNAYLVVKNHKQLEDVGDQWKGNITMLFDSFKEFEHRVNHLDKRVKAVVYDNEAKWNKTPQNEKMNAAHFAKRFGEVAHAHNLEFIAAPSSKFFEADARYADIIDMQLQPRESNGPAYLNAIENRAKQAHNENPDVEVVAQFSSSVHRLDPSHQGKAHAGELAAEHGIEKASKDGSIDGFWGYVYQENTPSMHAGQDMLEDLADKKAHGAKI